MDIEEREVMQELFFVICDIDAPELLGLSESSKIEVGFNVDLGKARFFPYGKMTLTADKNPEFFLFVTEAGRKIYVHARHVAYVGEVRNEEIDTVS